MAKKIISAAKHGSAINAAFFAKYGRELSYEENCVRSYYLSWDAVEAAMKRSNSRVIYPPPPKPDVDFRALVSKFKRNEEIVTAIFLTALHNHDGEGIMNLAKAVWFFKDEHHNSMISGDRERASLLFIKALSEEKGEKFPIQIIAHLAGLGNGAKEDGYSALRRKCKQLGVPIAPSRKIRPK